jgi:hypothetical protein
VPTGGIVAVHEASVSVVSVVSVAVSVVVSVLVDSGVSPESV